MTALAEVLAFKFPGIEHIRTREKVDHPEPMDPFSDMEIFDWPEAEVGRAAPTSVELGTWRMEFEALPVEQSQMDAEDVWRVLKVKGSVTDADVPGGRRIPK